MTASVFFAVQAVAKLHVPTEVWVNTLAVRLVFLKHLFAFGNARRQVNRRVIPPTSRRELGVKSQRITFVFTNFDLLARQEVEGIFVVERRVALHATMKLRRWILYE